MSRENIEVVRGLYEAFNRRDLPAMLAIADPEIELRTTVEVHHGHAGVTEWIDRTRDAWEAFTIEPVEIDAEGDEVIVAVRERARGRATGIELDERFGHVWTIRDGKATRLRAFSRIDAAREAVRERA